MGPHEDRYERLNIMMQTVDSGQYKPSISGLKKRLKQLDMVLQQIRSEQKVFGRVVSPTAVDTICDIIVCDIMALQRNLWLDKMENAAGMEPREPYIKKNHLRERFAERLFSHEGGEKNEYYRACMDILDTEPGIYFPNGIGGEALSEKD